MNINKALSLLFSSRELEVKLHPGVEASGQVISKEERLCELQKRKKKKAKQQQNIPFPQLWALCGEKKNYFTSQNALSSFYPDNTSKSLRHCLCIIVLTFFSFF